MGTVVKSNLIGQRNPLKQGNPSYNWVQLYFVCQDYDILIIIILCNYTVSLNCCVMSYIVIMYIVKHMNSHIHAKCVYNWPVLMIFGLVFVDFNLLVICLV